MKDPMQSRQCKTQHAYTLAEVIVAVFVLGILIVSLFGAFTSGLALAQLERENLRATQILMQKMETVRLFTWSQTSASNKFTTTFTDYYDPGASGSKGKGAMYQGFVSKDSPSGVPSDYSSNMLAVTVTVFWTNYPHGTNSPIVRTRQMQTLVARYGMQNYIAQ